MTSSNHELRKVEAIHPAAKYVGGKRLLAPKLIKRIDAIPHKTYAEPFVGMGGVFFRRTNIPSVEVINDLSGDVANFFRIQQRHYIHFMEMLKFQLTSRKEFERLKACDPKTLTDLERAARFLYLQRSSFGGQVVGRNFGVDPGSSGWINVTKLGPILEAIHERLAGVTVECLPYTEFIKRYDRKATLFYLDPPYWGTEGYYGKELFSRDDFEVMAKLLSKLKGRFILSINDTPDIRQIFKQFKFEETKVIYTTGGHGPKRAGELIISGP